MARLGRTNPFPVTIDANHAVPRPTRLYIQLPQDLKNTRVHSWNLACSIRSATTWRVGDLPRQPDGERLGRRHREPGLLPAGAGRHRPLHAEDAGAPGQTFPNCSPAPLDRPAGAVAGGSGDRAAPSAISTGSTMTAGSSTTGCCSRCSAGDERVQRPAPTTRSSKCEGLINQGGTPLNVGTGYVLPISLFNPPSEAEVTKRSTPTRARAQFAAAHLQPDRERGDAAVHEHRRAPDRVGMASVGDLPRRVGEHLTVTTGIDRALTGMQHQRVNQVMRRSVRRQDAEQLVQPCGVCAARARHPRQRRAERVRGPGQPRLDLSLVRRSEFANTHRIEARIEAFNAFNWFRWGNPNTR